MEGGKKKNYFLYFFNPEVTQKPAIRLRNSRAWQFIFDIPYNNSGTDH